MGRHANYLNGMTSWPLAATLALGRNTGLAILKDAGIPMHSALTDTARELGVNAGRRLFYAAHSRHAGKPGY
jgi:hypothetical protein